MYLNCVLTMKMSQIHQCHRVHLQQRGTGKKKKKKSYLNTMLTFCINYRPFLPFMTELLPLHDKKNVHNNEMDLHQSIIYQNDSRFDYQQRYQTQFRNNTTPFTPPQLDRPFCLSSLQQQMPQPTSPAVDTDFPFILSQVSTSTSMFVML